MLYAYLYIYVRRTAKAMLWRTLTVRKGIYKNKPTLRAR